MFLGFRFENKKQWTKSVINLSLIGSAISFLIHSVLDLPFLSGPQNSFCRIQFILKNATLGMTVFFAYFVLWFKVFTVFYRNESVRKNLSKVLQIVNVALMPLFLATLVIAGILLVNNPQVISAGCGCKLLLARERYIQQWIGVVACSTAFQTVLLFSFVYPLHIHSKKMLNNGLDDGYIYSIIRRATIAATFWVISDFFMFIFGAVYFDLLMFNHYIAHTFNLLITLNATILSFANWQKKLFPFGKNFQST